MYSDTVKQKDLIGAIVQDAEHQAKPLKRFDSVIVVGPAGVGKTTLAAELARRMGVRVGETGEIVLRYLAEHLAATTGVAVDQAIDRIRSCKEAWRADLASLGDMLTGCVRGHGDCLITQARYLAPMAHTAVISGVRRHREVEDRIAHGHYDLWLRVERPDYTPRPEDRYELANIERLLPADRCQFGVVVMARADLAGVLAEAVIKQYGLKN